MWETHAEYDDGWIQGWVRDWNEHLNDMALTYDGKLWLSLRDSMENRDTTAARATVIKCRGFQQEVMEDK